MFDQNSDIFLMKKSHSIDIDNTFDLEAARSIYYYSKKNNKKFFNL